MNPIHRFGLVIAGLLAASGSALAADVGVSVSVSQPGFYGRIDINQPPPPAALIYAQPVLVAPPPVVVARPAPVYLRVPPGHVKHWNKHCREYNACGVPVYFIQDNYYQQHYVVQQPPRVINGQPVMVVQERGEGRGRDRDDDDGPGRGRGKGHGKGHGHD